MIVYLLDQHLGLYQLQESEQLLPSFFGTSLVSYALFLILLLFAHVQTSCFECFLSMFLRPVYKRKQDSVETILPFFLY
jgi:phosphate starvation-inducible membrane PsiE